MRAGLIVNYHLSSISVTQSDLNVFAITCSTFVKQITGVHISEAIIINKPQQYCFINRAVCKRY
ncbi:hypothetical protein BN129_4324 [Cronobacter sakazakii 701]|nr:hypothetical protein BN129_4324 [Cronobacter sakazakii 701]